MVYAITYLSSHVVFFVSAILLVTKERLQIQNPQKSKTRNDSYVSSSQAPENCITPRM